MLSEFLCGCVVLLVLWWWVTWMWSRRHLYALSRNLPGPPAVPIIGNAIQLGCLGNHHEFITNIKNMMGSYGNFFRIWFGPTLMVCVCTEAEDYEDILTSKLTYNKGDAYNLLKYALKDGLFTANGNNWKKHRQIINPAFAKSTLKRYHTQHNYYATKMVESMRQVVDKGIVDVAIFASRYMADVVCDSLYNFKPNCYSGKYDINIKSIHTSAVLLHKRITKFWIYNDSLYERSSYYKEFQDTFKNFTDFFYPQFLNKFEESVDELIAENSTVEKATYNNLDADYVLGDNSDVKNRTVMNVLAEGFVAGDFTKADVLADFGNIFIPALDTSSNQLSSLLLMLGMHRRVQDKLWAEIREFYSHDLDAEVTNDHFSHLPYLDMVFKETMRCFPSGPMLTRLIKEDFHMKHRNVTLPAGTTILLLNILLHRNEKYWKNPVEFYPERFSPEESANRPYFAFIPFSMGLRNCIGQVFANDAIKTAVIHLIRNFEFTADPSWTFEDLNLLVDISTRIEAGHKVNVTLRNRDV